MLRHLAIILQASDRKTIKTGRCPGCDRFENRYFALQIRGRFGSLRVVRKSPAAFLVVLVALPCVHAQDQESKLVDRLLRPDTALRNNAQNKQFRADGASINKKATVGTFYVQKKSNSKSYAGTRDFSARQYNSQSFRGIRSASGTPKAFASSRPAYPTRTARGVRDAAQSDKKVASRSYAENRPFLDKGKSQKSLNRQNAPLTIEQVRELLNKNN